MPLCYWDVCNGPDVRPCVQHTGVECGTFNGVQVTKARDVNDAVTHRAELALIRMDDDKTLLNQLQARLEAR
jgi:hypothetical protein